MRKNKTGGRKHHHQRIVESEKRKDGTKNPKAGRIKLITHHIPKSS